jgi:hypothetical protein
LVVAVLPAVEFQPSVLTDLDEVGDLRIGIAHADQQRLDTRVLEWHHAHSCAHDQAGFGGIEVLDVAAARSFRQTQRVGGRTTTIDAGGLRREIRRFAACQPRIAKGVHGLWVVVIESVDEQ